MIYELLDMKQIERVNSGEDLDIGVMLPDGTAVWLNAGSQLSYSQGFGITDRNVRINGEGYFEVGKGSDMPMSVCSSNMCVRDIGTKFNFRDYPEEPTAEVTL